MNSNRTQTFLHSDFVFNWLKLSRSSGRDERALDGGSCVTGRNVAETLMRLYCTTIKKHCLRGLRTGKTQVETLIDEFIRLAAGIDRRCAFDQAVRGLCSQMLLLFFGLKTKSRDGRNRMIVIGQRLSAVKKAFPDEPSGEDVRATQRWSGRPGRIGSHPQSGGIT